MSIQYQRTRHRQELLNETNGRADELDPACLLLNNNDGQPCRSHATQASRPHP
jgi:hypothetical protein